MGSISYATVSMLGGAAMTGRMELTPYVTAAMAL